MARLLIVEDNLELAALIGWAARTRGHAAATHHSGSSALQVLVKERFDLAVVDLLLPDMRGEKVLDVLKERGVPAVAISGVYRGENFAEDARSRHGALDFVEKPFSVETLLERVDAALSKLRADDPKREGAPASLPGDGEIEEIDDLDIIEESGPSRRTGPPPAPPGAKAGRAPGTPASEPAAPTPPEGTSRAGSTNRPPRDDPERSGALPFEEIHAEDILSDTLGPAEQDEIEVLIDALREEERPPDGWGSSGGPDPALPSVSPREQEGPGRALARWAWEGTLESGQVIRLLTADYVARVTGELVLRRGDEEKRLAFREGTLCSASSTVEMERFLSLSERRGALSPDDRATVEQVSKQLSLPAGEAMVRMEILGSAERRALLEAQIAEIVSSVLSWEDGEFRFEAGPPRAKVVLSVFPGQLVLDKTADALPLERLQAEVGGSRRLGPAPSPPFALWQFELGDTEAQLLTAADGTKTAEDLGALLGMEERRLLALLWAFEHLGVLQPHRDTGPRQPRRLSFGL